MNVNQEFLQSLATVNGSYLETQLSYIFALSSLFSFILLIVILKKYTKWSVLVATTVVLCASFLYVVLSIPFQVITKLLESSINQLKQQSLFMRFVGVTLFVVWRAFADALVYLWSFKIFTYFDKNRTYKFGTQMFLLLFVVCIIPFIVVLLYPALIIGLRTQLG